MRFAPLLPRSPRRLKDRLRQQSNLPLHPDDIADMKALLAFLKADKKRAEAYQKEQEAAGSRFSFRTYTEFQIMRTRLRSQRHIKDWIKFRNSRKIEIESSQPNNNEIQVRPGHELSEQIRDRANVEAILEAVEPGYDEKPRGTRLHVPQNISRRRLRSAINWVSTDFKVTADFAKDSDWRKRAERMKEITETASKLHKLLTADDDAGRFCSGRIGYHFPSAEGAKRKDGGENRAPSMRGLLAGLVRLRRAAERQLSYGHVPSSAPKPLRGSSFQWLAGVSLPRLYTRFFGKPPTVSKSQSVTAAGTKIGKPNSAYIRFASAVLEDRNIRTADGEPYADSSIERALKDAKANRARRKPKSTKSRKLP